MKFSALRVSMALSVTAVYAPVAPLGLRRRLARRGGVLDLAGGAVVTPLTQIRRGHKLEEGISS